MTGHEAAPCTPADHPPATQGCITPPYIDHHHFHAAAAADAYLFDKVLARQAAVVVVGPRVVVVVGAQHGAAGALRHVVAGGHAAVHAAGVEAGTGVAEESLVARLQDLWAGRKWCVVWVGEGESRNSQPPAPAIK